MKKLLLLPILALAVASCGQRQVSRLNPENLPAYCIRGVEPVGDDVHVMLDMPGIYGESRNDGPIKVTIKTYETLTVPECAPNDPRMND
jgi:hypothetical protein